MVLPILADFGLGYFGGLMLALVEMNRWGKTPKKTRPERDWIYWCTIAFIQPLISGIFAAVEGKIHSIQWDEALVYGLGANAFLERVYADRSIEPQTVEQP